MSQIPANVTARLLPKTLFGERYVELTAPASASATPLRPGAVIGQDRSSSAIELEKVLDDTLPLLQTIQPDKLAATLVRRSATHEFACSVHRIVGSSTRTVVSQRNTRCPGAAVT